MDSKRIQSIDIVRGMVMIIMPLDHLRDLLHIDSLTQSPTNLSTTTVLLFFSRWITHLCAPVFFFLAGTSAYRLYLRQNDLTQTRIFLVKRGLFLIAIEFIVVNTILYFDPGFHTLLFEVIAAIGLGFILLALVIKWDIKVITALSLIIIFCHGLFPLIAVDDRSILKSILSPWFNLSVFPLSTKNTLVIAYPPIPWFGIMLAGFASGRLFDLAESVRKKTLLSVGAVSIGLFLLLRLLNLYGDPSVWTSQKNNLFTLLSFLNVSKYPPSLLFCLVTLGIMFIMLATAEKMTTSIGKVLTVYGSVPLFYFILHFLIIHVILIAILFLQGFSWSAFEFATGTFGRPKILPSGIELKYVLLLWVILVPLLYKPCIWFKKYKQQSQRTWVKYF